MQSETLHPNSPSVKVGCAGWSLPRDTWPEFPPEGSHLERYAARFNAVEINSSFYRPHQPATYTRWAATVPAHFRFCVKLPKAITHEQRLRNCNALLDTFMAQASCLGEKLGCLLVQLPPSLAFDPETAAAFLATLRQHHAGEVALEPRHASWFTSAADGLLKAMKVTRVLADPVLFDAASRPGGHSGLVYVRLHGSPNMYYSAYAPDVLDALAVRLELAAASDASVWCIFDNTANGAAVPDALRLTRKLARS
jgi:uncharacterized protein YecE (DUF72 family)